MLSVIMARPRRLTRVHCAAVWLCAFSLVLVLANRFPRNSSYNETSWVLSAPSQIVAKVLAKDFFLLLPPASGAITLIRSAPSPLALSEENPIVSISLDTRLFTRPPPSA